MKKKNKQQIARLAQIVKILDEYYGDIRVDYPIETFGLDLLQVGVNELLSLNGGKPIQWGEGACDRTDLIKHF